MSDKTEPSNRERLVTDALVHLADTLVEDYDVLEFLYYLCERSVDLADIDEAAVMLVSPNGRLQPIAASSERTHLLELFELQNWDGPCLDAFRTGEAISSGDLATSSASARWPLFAPQAVGVGFRSVHSVPMRLRNNVIGALNVLRVDTGDLVERDLRLVRALADVATIGVLQHRALDEANQASSSLQVALTSRIRVEQAKGIIAERSNVAIDDSFELLRHYARSHQTPISQIAAGVIEGSLHITNGGPRS